MGTFLLARGNAWRKAEEAPSLPAIRIRVYGFEEAELEEWPPDLRPEPVRSLDSLPEAPVVVHLRAFPAFREAALALGERFGRMPDAVLYRPPGEASPEGAASFVDAEVEARDWEALRRLMACPRRFRSAEWAEDVPEDHLFAMADPPTPAELADLPLPPEVREHLRQCAVCQEAFAEALRARRAMARMLCPPAARLIAYLRGADDPGMALHLERCRWCQAEAAALFPQVVPVGPSLVDRIADPRQPAFLREQAARRLAELQDLSSEILERLIRLRAPLLAPLQALRDWVERIYEQGGEALRGAEPWGVIRLRALARPPALAAAPSEAPPPLRLAGEVGGIRYTLMQQDPGGELWLSLEAGGEGPRRLRVVLLDPERGELVSREAELRPIRPDQVGTILFLGRASDLPVGPESAIIIRAD